MKKQLNFVVNGEPHDLYIEPKTLLVQVIRETLGLKGTHQACDSSSCAACTVIVDGMAVKSCSILALQVNGKEVTTIEGLAEGSKLHPIQQAYVDNWAFQCGYCTSGQIMATKALLDENPDPSREEIQSALDGHLCRCTAYNMINEAVQDAAKRLQARDAEAEKGAA
ncbi:MAG: (2Fe-2S)-binding protein [Acidobacteriota bacterium]|jgi:aerobic-type carbon monoxide dehydrogenase small subunit (CoxS/CutS family)|nr:(2Fe-2S)-binding protein [Acidobacteriota bacterium]